MPNGEHHDGVEEDKTLQRALRSADCTADRAPSCLKDIHTGRYKSNARTITGYIIEFISLLRSERIYRLPLNPPILPVIRHWERTWMRWAKLTDWRARFFLLLFWPWFNKPIFTELEYPPFIYSPHCSPPFVGSCFLRLKKTRLIFTALCSTPCLAALWQQPFTVNIHVSAIPPFSPRVAFAVIICIGVWARETSAQHSPAPHQTVTALPPSRRGKGRLRPST